MTTARPSFPRHPADLTQRIDPVAAYVKALSAHPRVEKLILFGSRAIGDNWPRSDVDMAVLLTEEGPPVWHEVQNAAAEAWTLIPIDLVDYAATSGPFREAIDRHGEVVYERA